MSLDRFVADRTGDATSLYPDLVQGSTKDNELVQESIESTGAVVMGRGAYDMAEGDFTGYEYHVPIFVLTHQPPNDMAKGESEGGLTFTFATEGIERAVEHARAAMGERDLTVVGGVKTAQQYLDAGLVDEFTLHTAPRRGH